MGYKYRGQLIGRGSGVVDIIEFVGKIAKCTDNVDRNINEFNCIYYPMQQFKNEILGISDEDTVIDEDEKAIKHSRKNK